MPDKRQLEEAFHLEPLPKRLACSSAVTGTVMSDERIFATLKHPRLENGGSSPFTTSPPFQQPAPICSFSFDEHRKQHQDDRSKRFYTRPPPYNNPHPHLTRAQPVFGADLNYGLERFTQRDDSLPEHLDALVAALQHRTENATGSEAEKDELDRERRRADVVTWRGIITKICSAYEQNAKAKFHDSIELNAMMLDNTLYLEEYTSAEAKAQKANKEANPKMKRMGYYGYCFESYCTVDTPAQVNQPFCAINPRTDSGTGLVRHPVGWSGDVNTNVQWCQVVKTKLGENRLVIGGEVDAVEYNPITGKQEMVELKTSMQMTRFQRGKFGKAMADQERFEKKLLKFFLQSYLLGVGKIVVGFRDDYEYIKTLINNSNGVERATSATQSNALGN
ncbi:related to Protein RAI1 [Melanopsichium pennsylvanicum]|uniref:Decapping nuclease n=2 Tax=Melanopsichium pennsylvanicum TaxID=63383 RepID=A0AAJ5C6D4_9BASI|nr:related to RAI1-Rat1p Interacting Protein, required for pre-rRNA processing [Melanopsichium pennsylvanicum 4]SNX85379.1 related to Protein RAI1 [Melanopsichium pennsylvanicum]